MNRLRQAWTWLQWPVALLLMVALGWMNRDGLARVASREIQWPYLVAAVVFSLACSLLTFWRWYLLVWGQEFPFRFRDAVRLGFLGQFSSYFAPGIVGGDLVKAIVVARQQPARRTVAVATVLLDRVLGLLSLFVLGAMMTLFASGMPASPQSTAIVSLLWIGSCAGLAGVGLTLVPGITRWRVTQSLTRLPFVGRALADLVNGVALYQSRPMVLVAAVLIGLVSHTSLIAGFYCGGRAVEPWVAPLSQHFLFMPVAETFATLLPVPAGIGGLEGAVQYFYGAVSQGAVPLKQAENAGFIAALVFRLVHLGVACGGYGYSLIGKNPTPLAGVADESPNPPAAAASQPVTAAAP